MSYNVISLDGNDYIIVDKIRYNNCDYYYVINESDDNNNVCILKRTIENNMPVIRGITNKIELNLVSRAFAEGNV